MSCGIDLHMHTTASDGSDSPAELLEKLRDAGVHTFAITDHDTVDGAQAMLALSRDGLRFVPGIEFSCVSSEGECHILGYCCDFDDDAFLAALEAGSALRRDKLERRLRHLNARFGIAFSAEELDWLRGQSSPGKPHFARLLVAHGWASTIDEAIQRYFSGFQEGSTRIPAAQAIAAILHAGGIPVWAHPLGGEGERRLTEPAFLRQLDCLTALGVRGLECCYSRYDADESSFLRAHAARRGLYVSGGSDYHGRNKRGISLGQLNVEDAPVDPEALTLLREIADRDGFR